MNAFVIGDAELCIGCQACMIACARAHEQRPTPDLNTMDTPFHARLAVINAPEVTVAVQCRQCEDSPCARSCPEEAIIQKDCHIEVIKEKCIGCKSCVLACPFGAMKVVEEAIDSTMIFLTISDNRGQKRVKKPHFVVEKCDLCADCGSPACIAICPAEALQLVGPDTIAQKIESRLRSNAERIWQYR